MNTLSRFVSSLLLALLPWCSQAASTPAALAEQMQKAMRTTDFEAARALVDLRAAPPDMHFYYFMWVLECGAAVKCTFSVEPIAEERRAEVLEETRAMGATIPVIEGEIVALREGRPGSPPIPLEMPFGKSEGDYKFVVPSLTADEIARRRAQTATALLKELFESGIYDRNTKARRKDWATAATALPADGGEPGAELVRQTNAMSAAVDAKDPDAAMRVGTRWAASVFADKEPDGSPIPLQRRRDELHVQSLRMLRDVHVTGGYRLGYQAVLLVEARNGIGWRERGAVVMRDDGGQWEADKKTAAFPDE